MAFYTVTYDLNKKKDYAKFEEGIGKVSSNTYVDATLSQYIIESHLTAAQVRVTLQAHADSDDAILVLKLDVSDWSYTNLPDDIKVWLQAAINANS